MSTSGPSPAEGYEGFFGLHEPPFSLNPDPRFLFASASHSTALSQVAYALERREPLVVITGEIGTGKTLLCRTVLQRFERKTFLSIVDDPQLDRDDLLKQVLQDFGVISKDRTRLTPTTRHELVQALADFLRTLIPIQAHAVLIIDEAQHLAPDVLEQIRLLSNVGDDRGTLLQIVLVGQTDLDALLLKPELRQLQQRISRRLRLEPLNGDEVRQYIDYRLVLARDGTPQSQAPGAAELARALNEWRVTNPGVDFTPDAVQAITKLSGGLPRAINRLCDRALESAYEARQRVVDARMVEAAARALDPATRAVVSPPPVTAPPVIAPRPVPEPGVFPVAPVAPVAPAVTPVTPPLDPAAARPADTTPESEREEIAAAFHDTPPAMPQSDWMMEEDKPFTPMTVAPGGIGSRMRSKYAVAAIGVGVAAAALWFGLRSTSAPPATQAAPPAAATPTIPREAAPTPTPAPAGPPATAPTGGPTTAAPASSPAAATAPAADAFDILVASFRTEARAVAVASQVDALGLRTRRRALDAWQQVVAGPFATRAEAEAAQQKLHAAGLGGTQIVPASR